MLETRTYRDEVSWVATRLEICSPLRAFRALVATVVLAVALMLLIPGAAHAANSYALEAESMQPPASAKVFYDATASGSNGLVLVDEGTAAASFEGPADRVTVRARGDQCKGAPRMVVKVDGSTIMSRLVDSTGWTNYTASTNIGSGAHTLKISYTNEYSRAGICNRNLRLDKTTFGNSATSGVTLPALSVSGNHIIQEGNPEYFNFHGVNRDSLEWSRNNWGGCGGDGHFTDADYANIASWNANAVRIPLSQANWLGRRCDPDAYARMVDQAVAAANARGMYVILDLHWSDVGGQAPCDGPSCASGQQPLPDSDSITFWREVSARYANNPGVIFDLYNEPYIYRQPFVYNQPDEELWKCWRDGGCTVYASEQTSPRDPATGNAQPLPYTAVGMQQLYDAVREQAPDNIVMIGGLDWGYDLAGIGAGYAISGYNIVYDTHVYTQWHNAAPDWDAHFGYVTNTYPVSASEFGSVDCSADVTSRLLDYFDAPMGNPGNRMSWTVWSWNSPGECSQPSVLADWNGTPLADQGQLIHDRLQSYAR